MLSPLSAVSVVIKPAASRLPIEILEQVFYISCRDDREPLDGGEVYRQLSIFASVCRTWNQIIGNAPLLWNVIRAQNFFLLKNGREVLILFLKRAQTSPLDIRLGYPEAMTGHGACRARNWVAEDVNLASTAFQLSSRYIQRLKLHVAIPEVWEVLLSPSPDRWERLVAVTLKFGETFRFRDNSHHRPLVFPNLRHLRLFFPPSQIAHQFNFAQVTHLTIHSPYTQHSCDIIKACSAVLVCCRISSPPYGYWEEGKINPIECPKLRSFVTNVEAESVIHYLNILHMPLMQILHLEDRRFDFRVAQTQALIQKVFKPHDHIDFKLTSLNINDA